MNHELPKPQDLVSTPVLVCFQKKFIGLHRMSILMIDITLFNFLLQKLSWTKDRQIFCLLLRNIGKTLAPRSTTNHVKKFPTEYHELFDGFSQMNSNKFRPYNCYDHKIPLIEGKNPSGKSLSSISQDKLKCRKKYLDKHLNNGFIRTSFFPTTSRVFFAYKLKVAYNFALTIDTWTL